MSSVCRSSSLLSTVYLIKFLLNLICITAPILLIVVLMITTTKEMLKSETNSKELIKKCVNKIILCVTIFLIPIIVSMLLNLAGDDATFTSCWNNATISNIKDLRAEEESIKLSQVINYDNTKEAPEPTEVIKPPKSDNVVYKGETPTLKVYISKKKKYYISRIWAQNPYMQMNKFLSPKYGQKLVKPGKLLEKAMKQDGLEKKLMIGFNTSGFYLAGTYNPGAVRAYPPYNLTSSGSLVIANGKVIRNAYMHAYKTWFVTGITKDNRFVIFKDVKTTDYEAKKEWSESVIKSGIRNTFTFASPLVENGKASKTTTNMPGPKYKKDRQAFCQIDSNNFVAITGKDLNRQDLIDIMLSLNCQTGMNFDGGGSIALLFKSRSSTKITTVIGNNRNLAEVTYFTE